MDMDKKELSQGMPSGLSAILRLNAKNLRRKLGEWDDRCPAKAHGNYGPLIVQ